MDEVLELYQPICSRKQIGNIFYPNAKVPANGVTKTYATDPSRKLEFEAMDLGTYCISNDISGDMLLKIDGEMLGILLELTRYMSDKICANRTVSPELIDKFNKFMEFEKLREQMEQSK